MRTILQEYEHLDVGLGFAGEYVSNVASAFGHVFIIFIDPDNFILSPTFSYLANTSLETNNFRYILKGLFGGFNGEFKSVPFYKLDHVYGGIEKRSMWIYKFKEGKSLKNKIILNIMERERNKNLPYFFTNYNCTTALRKIINSSLETDKTHRFFDYPASLISDLNDELVFYRQFENQISKLHNQKTSVRKSELQKIQTSFKTKDALPQQLTKDGEIYAQTLYEYYSFEAKSLSTHKDLVSKIPFSNIQNSNDINTLPSFKQYQVSISTGEQERSKVNKLTFSPSYKHKYAERIQDNKSSLELFTTSIIHSEGKFLFNEFTLFSMENNTSFEWPAYITSSQLSLKYDRFCGVKCDQFDNIKLDYTKGISYSSNHYYSTIQAGPALINMFSGNLVKPSLHLFNESGISADSFRFIFNINYFDSFKSLNEIKINPFVLFQSDFGNWSIHYVYRKLNRYEINGANLEFAKAF